MYDLAVPKEIAESSKKRQKIKMGRAKNGKYYLPVSINKISIQKEKRKWLLILKL
jgi:hypothetical protein